MDQHSEIGPKAGQSKVDQKKVLEKVLLFIFLAWLTLSVAFLISFGHIHNFMMKSFKLQFLLLDR